jgi:hypothetical protein
LRTVSTLSIIRALFLLAAGPQTAPNLFHQGINIGNTAARENE